MMIIIFSAAAMSRSTPRKEQTHERIVEVAARAVRREGYAGVGVADIMKEAGLTTAASTRTFRRATRCWSRRSSAPGRMAPRA